MTSHVRDCIERAQFCATLARAERDPALREFLERLARQWVEAANDAPKETAYSMGTA